MGDAMAYKDSLRDEIREDFRYNRAARESMMALAKGLADTATHLVNGLAEVPKHLKSDQYRQYERQTVLPAMFIADFAEKIVEDRLTRFAAASDSRYNPHIESALARDHMVAADQRMLVRETMKRDTNSAIRTNLYENMRALKQDVALAQKALRIDNLQDALIDSIKLADNFLLQTPLSTVHDLVEIALNT